MLSERCYFNLFYPHGIKFKRLFWCSEWSHWTQYYVCTKVGCHFYALVTKFYHFLRQSFGERSEYDLALENPLGRGRLDWEIHRLRNSDIALSTQIKVLNQHQLIRIQLERLIGIISGIILIQFGQASLDLSLQ